MLVPVGRRSQPREEKMEEGEDREGIRSREKSKERQRQSFLHVSK